MVEKILWATDHPGRHPIWRSSQADKTDIRIDNFCVGEKLPIHPFTTFRLQHMGFVDQNQIEGIQFWGAFVDRLNPCHDNRVIGIAAV